VTFRDTNERLVAQVRTRMHNGELTERALARHLGISQPHVNNVLRGRRKLSPEVADLILKFFHCSLLDLYADGELRTNLHGRTSPQGHGAGVEVLKRQIGPGKEWSVLPDAKCRYCTATEAGGIPQCMVFVRLAHDTHMPALLCECDIALLDTSISARLADCPAAIFVIQRGRDTLLRWIRGGFRNLYIADEQTLNHPQDWEPLAMREDQRLQFVKGRILWLGAEASLRRA
jgi:transcriptional regulator with XRE-family HTH domain